MSKETQQGLQEIKEQIKNFVLGTIMIDLSFFILLMYIAYKVTFN